MTRTLILIVQGAALALCSSCVYWTPMSRQPAPSARVIPDVPLQKWDIESCGAGSLSTVLQHYGDPTPMSQWEFTLPRTRGGVLSIDLVLAAREKGFDARLITGDRGTVERELIDGRPVILMLQVIQAPGRSYDFYHYVVLDGIDPAGGLVRVQFGDRKARWVRFEKLEKAWRGGGHAQIIVAPKDPASDALRAAVALEEQGRTQEAAAAYQTILSDHPRSVLAWTNLGNARAQLGDKPGAEEAFRKAISLDSSSADALNNLAWLLYQQERLAEAEVLARQAVASPAPDPWVRLDTLARIQLARGACHDAVRTWERALRLMPLADRTEMALAAEKARGQCKS